MSILLQAMHAELLAEMPSPERFAEVARGWLTGTLREVFTDLFEDLRARPVTGPLPSMSDIDKPWGQPSRVLGRVWVHSKHPHFGGRSSLYSDRTWQRTLSELDKHPFAVRLTITPLDDRGYPLHGAHWDEVAVARDERAPEWARFSFSAAAPLTGWPDSAELQDRCAEFVKRQAAVIRVSGGSMTDDVGPGGPTALQLTTLNLRGSLRDLRGALRGYSWVTVVPAELATRLPDAAALGASGAFHEVSILPGGDFWLRATPTINAFSGDRIRRVFMALAPVLITGRAEFRTVSEKSFRLVEGVDAADYQ